MNAVCPGYTDTDLLSESAQKVAEKTGSSAEQVLETFKSANRQSRFVEPDEVASAVAWLCLPEQRSVTGQQQSVMTYRKVRQSRKFIP